MAYSNDKKSNNASYEKLKAALKNGNPDKCYIFHGEEQYLLMHSLSKLRALLCPSGLDGFNYKRFNANELDTVQLEEAIEVMPLFAERTLIEIHEYNMFKAAEEDRTRINEILADLPDHVCVVFVFSATEYKPDGRKKTTKDLLKHVQVVEFAIQEEKKLVEWITAHMQDAGKDISPQDAKYLAEITGGLMTKLQGEIEKVAAYSKKDKVSKNDIDAVVTPVLDVEIYRLTNAIVERNHKKTLQVLDTLFQMREPPHRLMYSISLKLRQLLAARVCIDNNVTKGEFMKICDIKTDYPASILLSTARKASLTYCRDAVLLCSQTAKELNSQSNPEEKIVELVLKLSMTA